MITTTNDRKKRVVEGSIRNTEHVIGRVGRKKSTH